MDWRIIERDRQYVVDKLRAGVFEALEVVTCVAETEFFYYLLRQGDLAKLAASYPSPRKREDVPLWVYLSSELSMRINAQHGFKSTPYVLPCSGLRNALGIERQVCHRRAAHRISGFADQWQGFNQKNAYARQTPCDQDYLRKMARDTDPDGLQAWHNHAVTRYYGSLDAYDPEGIFIADGTYLFVPDNPRYENSAVLVFDKHNHPVSRKEIEQLPEYKKRQLHTERCYRKVDLLHTTRDKDIYLYVATKVMNGRASETPQLGPLVDGFVKAMGKGVMKVLIHDRGFIDGVTVTRNKLIHGVDAVFPLKKNMDCWAEAWSLAEFSDDPWVEVAPPETADTDWPVVRPQYIQRREEKRQATLRKKREQEARENTAPEQKPKLLKTAFKAVKDLRIWDACEVPIHVAVMRDLYEDGHESRWVLASTMDFDEPIELRQYYQLRPTIEERIRQTKCFWDLAKFRSTKFSLVVNQIVFVLMAYTLVQIFLLKTGRKELAKHTRERLFEELFNQDDKMALYCDGRVAFLPPLDYQEIILGLEEHARRKILGLTRKLQAQRSAPPEKPWRP